MRDIIWAVKAAVLTPAVAKAHVAEQGFVLLLPTGAYTAAGVAVVIFTILALAMTPEHVARKMLAPRFFHTRDMGALRTGTSLISTAILAGLVLIGLDGPRSPLTNLMPLTIWTVFWIALVTVAGVAGDLWRWINPWSGVLRIIGQEAPILRLPQGLGVWPAMIIMASFFAFLLADVAPDDPARLAWLIGSYWVMTFAALILFGDDWMQRGEAASVLFRVFGDLSAVRFGDRPGSAPPGGGWLNGLRTSASRSLCCYCWALAVSMG